MHLPHLSVEIHKTSYGNSNNVNEQSVKNENHGIEWPTNVLFHIRLNCAMMSSPVIPLLMCEIGRNVARLFWNKNVELRVDQGPVFEISANFYFYRFRRLKLVRPALIQHQTLLTICFMFTFSFVRKIAFWEICSFIWNMYANDSFVWYFFLTNSFTTTSTLKFAFKLVF